MVEGSSGRIFKASEESVIAIDEGDEGILRTPAGGEGKSMIEQFGDSVGKVYKIELSAANGWPDGRYFIGCGTSRAYFIGDGVEGRTGDDAGGSILPVYKMQDETVD